MMRWSRYENFKEEVEEEKKKRREEDEKEQIETAYEDNMALLWL